MRRVSTAVLLIGLLTLSSIPLKDVNAQSQASGNWIDPSQTKEYVDNLISDYNALVQFHQAPYSNFTANQGSFQLWHGDGYSFEVSAMMRDPNASAAVAFVFGQNKILGSNPDVAVYDNETLQGLLSTQPLTKPGTITIDRYPIIPTPYGYVISSVYLDYPNTVRWVPTVWVTNSTSVNDTYGDNAKDAAAAIYAIDVQDAVNFDHSHSSLNWLLDPLFYAGGVAFTIALAIQLYFGSIRDFIQVLENPKERRKAIQELKNLRRKKVEGNKKDKEQKSQ